uniref:Uncharacterized protein n=1 Tax=Oryza nivara TaxID=4536 RepID=A0A0E0G2C1_ORYNI
MSQRETHVSAGRRGEVGEEVGRPATGDGRCGSGGRGGGGDDDDVGIGGPPPMPPASVASPPAPMDDDGGLLALPVALPIGSSSFVLREDGVSRAADEAAAPRCLPLLFDLNLPASSPSAAAAAEVDEMDWCCDTLLHL